MLLEHILDDGKAKGRKREGKKQLGKMSGKERKGKRMKKG